MWKSIKNGFWKGVREANDRFEAERSYPPDQEIARGWERGKQAAADGKSIRAAMGRDDKTKQTEGDNE